MSTGDEGILPKGAGTVFQGVSQAWRKYMTRRMVRMLAITIGGLVVVFALVFLLPIAKYLLMTRDSCPRCQTVSTVHAQKTLWQTQITAVGTLHAIQGANLGSELAGIVTRIGFEPGQDVEKGTLLVQLRDDSDRAQLSALRASAQLAAQTFARDAELIKTNAISKQVYDAALATLRSARAQAEAQAALVDKKAIRAPYPGRVGIRQVDVGQYVTAGQTVVALEQLDPIYVDFTVPQQEIARLKPGAKIALTSDAAQGRKFDGQVLALDPQVDPVTRNIRVRALVQNPEKTLLPGMFATVVAEVGKAKPYITLPQTAIVYNTYGNTVFVVGKGEVDGKPELVAQQRFVTTGETRGDQIAVTGGLSIDDTVVSAGQIKLKNGTPIRINNRIQLPNNPAPTPVQQ